MARVPLCLSGDKQNTGTGSARFVCLLLQPHTFFSKASVWHSGAQIKPCSSWRSPIFEMRKPRKRERVVRERGW